MREMKYLKVSADIARRAGVIDVRFRTFDGDFIITENDLRMVRFEPEEYVEGVAMEVINEQEAAKLIAENNNQIGEEISNEEKNELDTPDILPVDEGSKDSSLEDNFEDGKEASND